MTIDMIWYLIPVLILCIGYVFLLRCRKGHPGLEALRGWSYAHRGLHGNGVPENSLQEVTEGASLVHMMNSNIFTGVVFKLSEDAAAEDLAKDWRDAIQGNRWICGMPDRLILADVDGQHILMVFASKDILTTFENKLTSQYPQARILYNEAVVS